MSGYVVARCGSHSHWPLTSTVNDGPMLCAVTPRCERCGSDNLCHANMPLHSNAKVLDDLAVAANQRLLVCHGTGTSVGAVVLDSDKNCLGKTHKCVLADDGAGGREHHLESDLVGA